VEPRAVRGSCPRRPGQPSAAPALVTFIDRRKRSTVANVAIARELAGWCWSLAVLDDM